MSRPAVDPKQLVVLAVLEGLIAMVVVIRGVVLGSADLERPLHLAWFAGTLVLAASALAVFVVRSAGAARQAGPGGPLPDPQALLGPSLGVLGLAGLLALAGPQVLERLLG